MGNFKENQYLFPDDVLKRLKEGIRELKIEVVQKYYSTTPTNVEGIVDSVTRDEEKGLDWLCVKKGDGKTALLCSEDIKDIYIIGILGERDLLYNIYASRQL